MPRTQNRAVFSWILVFGSFAVFLVIFGGFVRLTRSGLSIVEWNPVMGVLPPLSQQAWQAEFAKYQLSPEYQQINYGMTLAQYQEIFTIEWLHRIFARLAGLIFAVPFFVFVIRKTIPLREAGLYVVMGLLFLAQAVMGWIMVASGLVERPSVSHYLLTAHLFLALSLIALSAWTALGHFYGFSTGRRTKWSSTSRLVLAGLLLLLGQIAYGGFTAGLKAGHISNTWPLMLGRLVPQQLFGQVEPPLLNLIDAPLTVMFIHRWYPLLLLVIAAVIFTAVRRLNAGRDLRVGVSVVMGLGLLQIILGIAVVTSGVSTALALLHQFNALCLFVATVFVLHRQRARDSLAAVPVADSVRGA